MPVEYFVCFFFVLNQIIKCEDFFSRGFSLCLFKNTFFHCPHDAAALTKYVFSISLEFSALSIASVYVESKQVTLSVQGYITPMCSNNTVDLFFIRGTDSFS